MAIQTDFSLFRGEDVVIPFDVDENITGWTLTMLVNPTYADSSPTLTGTVVVTAPLTGLCQTSFTKANTLTLVNDAYHWELVRTNAGSETVLAYGTITVHPRIGV